MSHLSTSQISASLDGALTGPDSGSLLAHLSSCVVCREHRDRVAMHDDALRRLFSFEPDHQALDASARAAVERFARFKPPQDHGPASIQQDTTATPADPTQSLPPAREPSRGMRVVGPEVDAQSPLAVEPRLDTERVVPPAGEKPRPLVETYDAFNDSSYAGPSARESPPMLGRPPVKKAGEDTPAARKEYRHGGVRRDVPATSDRDREAPARRDHRGRPAPRDDGFGVKRGEQPAWARMGLEPDPSSPGSFRETLTGATISPPPVNANRSRSARSSGKRTALIATLALAAGLAVVALAMRVPTGAHLSFGHAANSTPASAGSIEVRSATTPPPVDVAVTPAPGGAATASSASDETQVCGQVVDANGRPIDGALLTVAVTATQARTGADGRFCLKAPVGTQLVEVLDPRGSGTTARQMRMSFVSGAPETRLILP
jgi:hypothetical protein